MIVATKRFDYLTDLSNITGDFLHFAIEVNHPTTIIINNSPFRIGYNCILELTDCNITSIELNDQSIQGIITYEKEDSD